MAFSYSFHLSAKSHSVNTTGKIGQVSRHNLREYESADYDRDQIEILRGSNTSILDSVKEIYHKEFDEALERYNDGRRADRQIDDYLKHVSDSRGDVAAELIIQIGDMDFWEGKTMDEKKQMSDIFKGQLEELEKLAPNFKIASAVVHYDEKSPHMHVVGVPVADDYEKGLEKRVAKTRVFTKESLSNMQDGMRMNAELGMKGKELFAGMELKEKELGRNKDIPKNHLEAFYEAEKQAKEELEQAKEELEDVRQDQFESSMKNMKLTEKNNALAESYSQALERYNALAEYMPELQRESSALQAQLSQGKQALDGIRQELDDLTQERDRYELEIAPLRASMESLKEKVAKLKERAEKPFESFLKSIGAEESKSLIHKDMYLMPKKKLEKLYDAWQAYRTITPEDLEVLTERDKIIADAQQKAEDIIAEAEADKINYPAIQEINQALTLQNEHLKQELARYKPEPTLEHDSPRLTLGM